MWSSDTFLNFCFLFIMPCCIIKLIYGIKLYELLTTPVLFNCICLFVLTNMLHRQLDHITYHFVHDSVILLVKLPLRYVPLEAFQICCIFAVREMKKQIIKLDMKYLSKYANRTLIRKHNIFILANSAAACLKISV